MVQAQRYYGVTAIFALSEVEKMYPLFNFDKFIGDAAHDNYPTYKLLNEWNIKAVISLNPKGEGKINTNHQSDLPRMESLSESALNQWYMIDMIKEEAELSIVAL